MNYYSPSYNGFNFGVTFIPDIDQHGTVTRTKSVARDFASSSNDSPYNGAMGYKNIFQGALAYEGKMSQVAVKLSATGEAGDAKKDVNTGAATTYNRHDLRAYELGGSLGYKCFTLGGSYGNLGKSGAYKSTVAGTPVGGKKDGHFWTAGLAYEHEKFGASFTHFNSKSAAFAFVSGTPAYSNLKADTKTYSLGMDYKLAPGFMPYAELTMFDMKDKAANTKNDGSVLLFGTKLNF